MKRIGWLLIVSSALFTFGCNQPAVQRTPPVSTPGPAVSETAPTPSPAPTSPKILEMPAPDSSNPQAVDINVASFDQLRKMPFIGDSYAMKIIQARPYKRKDELSSRNILPPHVYQKAKDYLIASGSR